MMSDRNDKFISNFNLNGTGFYDLTPFSDVEIGFSVKRKLNEKDDSHTSLIGIVLFNKVLSDESLKIKPLHVHVVYGEKTPEGVVMRNELNIFEPVDVEFDEFFYDIENNQLYRKGRKITGNELLKEAYDKHV